MYHFVWRALLHCFFKPSELIAIYKWLPSLAMKSLTPSVILRGPRIHLQFGVAGSNNTCSLHTQWMPVVQLIKWLVKLLLLGCGSHPYRLTYFGGVICVSINIPVCAWKFGQFTTYICILIIQFVMLFLTKSFYCVALYFINFTMTSRSKFGEWCQLVLSQRISV